MNDPVHVLRLKDILKERATDNIVKALRVGDRFSATLPDGSKAIYEVIYKGDGKPETPAPTIKRHYVILPRSSL